MGLAKLTRLELKANSYQFGNAMNLDHATLEHGAWRRCRGANLMRYSAWVALWVLGLGFQASVSLAVDEKNPQPEPVNYGRPFEPPTRPALIPLPPGTVEPGGWIRDWCLTARDGYTGHEDEVHEAFRQAWAVDYTMTGEKLMWPKGGWPYEGGGYWLDGLVRLGYALHDDFLINKAKSRLDAIVNHRNENAILFTWWLNKNNPDDLKDVEQDDQWPFWANGLMGRTLAAYYAGSKDQRVLRALEGAYSANRRWVRKGAALSNIWPAFEAYTWTGNGEIKEALTELFAKDADERTSNSKWRYLRMPSEKPGAEKPEHGVVFLESIAPWVLGYLWTGNREFLQAPSRWHEVIERDAMQPHGVYVCDEFYGPTGAYRGTETCDVSGYMWSQILLLMVGGQGSLGDKVERAFFNAAPATVSRDFKTHVYFQSPNRIKNDLAGQFVFQRTHGPLCCTAALNRFLPIYVTHMWMATYDNGLAAVHYGPCKVSALVADRMPVELTCRTDYPFNDSIDITVMPAREATFPLSFRIPGWCANPELTVNGSAIKAAPDAEGFVRVQRLWKPDDRIRLRFPMSVRVKTGRDQNAHGAPYASVSYGPLLFALPIPDTKDANTPDETAKWNYALQTEGEKLGSDITVERGPMPSRWNWPLESPLKLRAHALSFDWKPEPQKPLPPEPVAQGGSQEKITLVPYGCTKFRVSMFPITERTFQLSGPEQPVQPAGK